MFKKMIKSFDKKEVREREKYGDKIFLRKYINKYRSYTSTMRWLLPLNLIINLALVIIFLDRYISSNKTSDLVILILWSLGTLLWFVNALVNFISFFNFIDKKLISWKNELENIDKQKPI